MQIAIVGNPYYPVPPKKYGGIEEVIHYLIKGLKELGHTPILLAPGDSKVDCQIIPIVNRSIPFPRYKKDLPAYQKKIDKIIVKTEQLLRKVAPKVDIVHSHGFDLINFQDMPNLTSLHNMISFDELSYYEKRKNLYYASISLNQQNNFPKLQYVGAIYNGMDPADFPIVTKPEDYVCFLGRFDRDKNPHLAIQLAINLGIRIKVAGKIDHKSDGYFEEEVEKYLSHPLVEYLGEIGFKEKVELLGRAKCNLHPTGFKEPFGLTVLEAAYCGTPTLAIARGSMLELIEQGKTGLLVEDFVEGYHLIEKCFAMNRTYIAERTRRLFNYRIMSRQYVKAYQSIIKVFKAGRKQDQRIRTMT